MSNSYVKTPMSISYASIREKGFTLSSSQYRELVMPNPNFLYVKNFLSRSLQRKDLGHEVGSLNYINQSTHYFLRTKALQSHSFLPEITKETALPIMPQSFVQMDLKNGDLILSKDSNIGEIVMLDKDYPNFMLSGALYKLPVIEKKYYLLAFIKHNIFREQLDYMVPKGATIRHAKTKFLDCKIPLPNHNSEVTIKFVEILIQAIIGKEKLIKQHHEAILQKIEKELLENQKPNQFRFELPRIKEIEKVGRLDTGIYSDVFERMQFLIKNYKNGFFFIEKEKIKSGSTPQVRYIGNIKALKYRWVTPTHCADYGVMAEERINLQGNNNINEDCTLLINRGQGEDCGKSVFYNYEDIRDGHHNQGMYRVFDYEKNKLIFLQCVLNTKIYRDLCDKMSLGSKMKELKIEQFLQIPFPNFPKEKQKEIALLYHNSELNYPTKIFTLNNFLEKDGAYNEQAGIYELDKTAKQLKKILNKVIDDIVQDKEVTISFEYVQ